jgi:hypothetical protein
MNRACLTMNKPDRVPDHVIEVSQVHGLSGFIEAERKPNRDTRATCGNLLVRTLHVLKMARQDIDQFKFERLFAPCLADNRRSLSAFLGGAVDGMEDRDTGKIGVTNRAAVDVKFVEGRIDDDFQISSEGFHLASFTLDNRFYQDFAKAGRKGLWSWPFYWSKSDVCYRRRPIYERPQSTLCYPSGSRLRTGEKS